MRGKNGRFIKNQKIEFDFPTPYAVLKYISLFIVFLPWIYLAIFKFDAISIFENAFIKLFGPNNCSCPTPSQNNDY